MKREKLLIKYYRERKINCLNLAKPKKVSKINIKKSSRFDLILNFCFIEINISPEDIIAEERQKLPDVTEATAITQIPTQHPFASSSNTEIQLPVDTSAHYRVYRDLWNKGFFITEGDTFGGDFLLYPGDPIYFHASHIVHILDSPAIPSKKIACNCRLSVNVNKTCLYAYFNPETDKIFYQSIKWKSDLHN